MEQQGIPISIVVLFASVLLGAVAMVSVITAMVLSAGAG